MPRAHGRRPAPRWGAQRRLEFIEFRLFWQGTLNRGDLREQFGISQQQASADIAAYQKRAPRNCEYDRNAKTYLRGESFEPIFGMPAAQTYLNELRSVDYGISTPDESRVGQFPPFATVPYPRRRVEVETLQKMLEAIEVGEALLIQYQSFSRPEPIWRWITPHALGYDSHRWHARAFCHIHGNFNDFVLGRILDVRQATTHAVHASYDREWIEEVELEIGLHPELPAHQRTAVELDHGMVDGARSVSVRAALMHYFLRWMRADLEPELVGPRDSQIVLLNRRVANERANALRNESAGLVEGAKVVRFAVP